MRALSLVLLSGVLAVACAGVIPRATPGQVQRAQATWPETTAATLDEGRSLYVSRCSACHAPYAPSHQVDWQKQVDEMATRAKLTPEQVTLVVRYLVTVSHGDPPPRAAAH